MQNIDEKEKRMMRKNKMEVFSVDYKQIPHVLGLIHSQSKYKGGNTWYSKSTEPHSQNQERDGNPSSVRKTHHQQQSGFHTKSCDQQDNLKPDVREWKTQDRIFWLHADATEGTLKTTSK